ncbi:hypothetical protein [Streptomyces sp. NPDC050422]
MEADHLDADTRQPHAATVMGGGSSVSLGSGRGVIAPPTAARTITAH